MEALWKHDGTASVRTVLESFPEKSRPAYTTVHTMMSRLETKKALRRIHKTGRAYIFEAMISRSAAQGRLADEFLGLFGGRMQPVMAHFVETGKLTLEDVHEAEKLLHELAIREKQK
jgi:BlaI family transcriptional regulator, penicillinase repressor